MAHLVLTGATGLVGSAALLNLISRPASEVSKVTILSRREVPVVKDNPRFETIIQKDFSAYDSSLLEKLKGATGVVWAQGISISQVPRDEYVKITIDYPLAAAKAFATLSDKMNFVYVSGRGANTSPGMLTQAFGKIKGQAETQLLEFATKNPGFHAYSARPAFVHDNNHPEIKEALASRNAPGTAEKLLGHTIPIFQVLMPGFMSPTEELGKVLVDLALGDGGDIKGPNVEKGRILESEALRRLFKEANASK